MTVPAQQSEWARGWPLVVSGALGIGLAQLVGGGIGVLMVPLQRQFGWTRAQISGGPLLICIAVLLLGPLVGVAINRFGARRIALIGIALNCTAVGCIGFAGPGIHSWYLAWGAVALTYPMVSALVWTLGVGRAFDKQRGMAFALTMSGVGIATFLAPLITVYLLPVVGWRGVYFTLSAGALVVGWPLMWLLFHPDRISLTPLQPRAGPPPALSGHAFSTVVKSGRFWALAAISLLLAAAVGGLMLHVQPIMRDAGLSAAKAAAYASLIGPASIAGHVVVGRMLDRFPARLVASTFFAAPAIVCALLLHYDPTPLRSVLAMMALGLSLGVEGDILAYLTAEYFGLKQYGVTFAILAGAYSLGFGISPVIAGAVYDAAGSYDSLLKVFIAGIGVSILLSLSLGRPPEFATDEAPEDTPLPTPMPLVGA